MIEVMLKVLQGLQYQIQSVPSMTYLTCIMRMDHVTKTKGPPEI